MIHLELINTQIKHTLPSSDPAEDELIEQYEAAAVAAIQRITGRYYGAPVSADLVAYGDGSSLLYLDERVTAIATLTERLYLGDTGTSILTGDTNGWALRLGPGQTHTNKVIRKGGYLWTYGYEYAVTGTIGYSAGNEPAHIRQAVLELAAEFYVHRVPVATGTIAVELPLHVKQLIATEIRLAA